jgi:hypothetical protein
LAAEPLSARAGVRPAHPQAAALLAAARAQSPTVAALIGDLEATDVVAYVQLQMFAASQTAATSFLAAGGGLRYLVMRLPLPNSTPVLIALLGHELQHAVEIGRSPRVRDEASLRSFYQEIGLDHAAVGRFETEAAIATTHRVRHEVDSPPSAPPDADCLLTAMRAASPVSIR